MITVSFGWRWALISLAAGGLVWCVVWLSTWRNGPYSASGKASKKTPAASADVEPATPRTYIFRSRTFVTGALVVMSVYALVSVVLTWLPSYFEEGLGYSRLQSGSMFAFHSIVGLVLMVLSSITSDRMISKGATSRMLRIVVPSVGFLVSGVLLFLLPSVGTPIIAVAILSIGYGFAATVFPLFNAAVAEICPPRQTAGTLGVFLAIWRSAVSSRRTPRVSSSTRPPHPPRATPPRSRCSGSSPRCARYSPWSSPIPSGTVPGCVRTRRPSKAPHRDLRVP